MCVPVVIGMTSFTLRNSEVFSGSRSGELVIGSQCNGLVGTTCVSRWTAVHCKCDYVNVTTNGGIARDTTLQYVKIKSRTFANGCLTNVHTCPSHLPVSVHHNLRSDASPCHTIPSFSNVQAPFRQSKTTQNLCMTVNAA